MRDLDLADVADAVSGGQPVRHVELDIDIGADARDWSAIQAQEKLKPVDTELRRIEASVNEIVQEMEYLRIREQKLRDTNESTNERVKWFALGTMGMLVGLGAWQVVYLRAYFRYAHRLVPAPGAEDSAASTDICTDRSISSRRIIDGLAWPFGSTRFWPLALRAGQGSRVVYYDCKQKLFSRLVSNHRWP